MDNNEAINALGTLCLSQEARLNAQQVVLDAIIGTLHSMDTADRHLIQTLRTHVLGAAAHSTARDNPDTASAFQGQIARTLKNLDVLLGA